MTDKTQPRDWSQITNKLYDAMFETWYCGQPDKEPFKAQALAILQEFDAQNQPNVSDNGASGVDLRDKLASINQWNKHMNKYEK